MNGTLHYASGLAGLQFDDTSEQKCL